MSIGEAAPLPVGRVLFKISFTRVCEGDVTRVFQFDRLQMFIRGLVCDYLKSRLNGRQYGKK